MISSNRNSISKNYHAENLREKKGLFKININEISVPDLA